MRGTNRGGKIKQYRDKATERVRYSRTGNEPISWVQSKANIPSRIYSSSKGEGGIKVSRTALLKLPHNFCGFGADKEGLVLSIGFGTGNAVLVLSNGFRKATRGLVLCCGLGTDTEGLVLSNTLRNANGGLVILS